MATRARLPLLLPLLATLGACGGGDEPGGATGDGPMSSEDLLARQRAAGNYIEGEAGYRYAFQELAPLADRPDASVDDLVDAASAALESNVAEFERARGWVERAAALDPDDPRVSWARYRIASLEQDWAEAERMLRAVLEAAPDDLPAKLKLADVLGMTAEAGDPEIERLLQEVVDVGPDFGGSWYAAGLYKLGRYHIESGDFDAGEELLERRRRLESQGVSAPATQAMDRGTFGLVTPPPTEEVYPRPAAELADLPDASWTWGAAAVGPAGVAGARGVQAFLPEERLPHDVATIAIGASLAHAFRDDLAAEELLVWGAGGLATLRWADGAWAPTPLLDEEVFAAVAFDLGDPGYSTTEHPAHAGDGDADFVAATAEGLVLLERKEGELVRRDVFAYDAPPAAVLAVDYDHEGDIDLLLVGDDGATLLRNDGVHEPGGAFTDATEGSGLPRGRAFAWALAEDLDRDDDVDLLMGGAGGAFHASNERGGTFSDASAALPDGLGDGARALDRDGDGWPDLVAADGLVWTGNPSGSWSPAAPDVAPPGPDVLAHETVDVPFGAALLDKEGDGHPDLVALAGDELATRAAEPEPGATALRLALQGDKDNHRGVGAVVELVLGDVYRRWYWRGGTLAVATNGRETIDVLRVTWPNGVNQNLIDAPGAGDLVVKQRPGLVGSCPFLYTWDGERFTFVSDVLGITPLGLPMAPGALVPPDHDEYVLVRGDQLAPKDGEYVLQVTEELREVTYLDRISLHVVDHPAGVEVHPNERFTFPPFPEHHVHALRDPLAPAEARGPDGADWTAALAADDGDFAEPFTALGGQFQGLAEPWFVELRFDPERVRDAERLRLALNGWFFWTDASVNLAAARHPRHEFVPPLLQVPDGEGGWRDAGVLGFPAGKLKTMVVDVTDRVPREDPRLRIFTTLQLYWDSIRLAVDPDDAPRTVTVVDPASAELWQRGFSKPIPHPDHPELVTFDWEEREAQPRWNQHPGDYTRLGDCLDLVTSIDDRFAIFGAGDALTVRFPAAAAPPLPDGWERDFLVFFDGWAKDRDPNTVEALYVEPLPFHGMSAYPYAADESYPNTPTHRAYRRAWNTRPATRWIEPLAPR